MELKKKIKGGYSESSIRWIVEGDGQGWIYKKKFRRKWEAKIAMEVFKKGGRISDYWREKKKHPKRIVSPWRVTEELGKALKEIEALDPTSEEIEEYAQDAGYGVVTVSKSDEYFGPSLHDTWGQKSGGRVHIDIGSGGWHLMLDRFSAFDFIAFIKEKRKKVQGSS